MKKAIVGKAILTTTKGKLIKCYFKKPSTSETFYNYFDANNIWLERIPITNKERLKEVKEFLKN